MLEIIHDVFYAPCEAALMSNRAILSAQNVKLIFSDVLQLRDLSRCVLVLSYCTYVSKQMR